MSLSWIPGVWRGSSAVWSFDSRVELCISPEAAEDIEMTYSFIWETDGPLRVPEYAGTIKIISPIAASYHVSQYRPQVQFTLFKELDLGLGTAEEFVYVGESGGEQDDGHGGTSAGPVTLDCDFTVTGTKMALHSRGHSEDPLDGDDEERQ